MAPPQQDRRLQSAKNLTARLGDPPKRTLAGRALHRFATLSFVFSAIFLASYESYAAAPPRFLPDRDVKVQYTLSVPGRPSHPYDLSFSAESKRLRIDDPIRKLWFLVNLPNASAALVIPELHAVVTEPNLANLAAILQDMNTAQFTPLGKATIVGLSCTRYEIVSTQVTGTACLTPDGVALLVSGKDSHGSARVVANSVTMGTIPPDRFSPPANFSTITLPRRIIAALLGQ